jgi:hypothetical protein
MQVVLEIVSGPRVGHKVSLQPGQVLHVGRTDQADFVVADDEQMSRVHLALELGRDTCHVRDLNSSNGTFINGNRVDRAMLRDGDRLTAGKTTFLFRLADATPSQQVTWDASAAAYGPPSAEPPAAPVQRAYCKQTCDSGLSLFHGPTDPAGASAIARLLAGECPLYLVIDRTRLNGEDLTLADPDYLFYWLPDEPREKNSPVIVSASKGMDLFSLVEKGWGKDAVLAIYSDEDPELVVEQLRSVAGAFTRPSVLRPQLSVSPPEYADNLFVHLIAVLMEGESPDDWRIYSKSDFEPTLEKLSFVPQPESGA